MWSRINRSSYRQFMKSRERFVHISVRVLGSGPTAVLGIGRTFRK